MLVCISICKINCKREIMVFIITSRDFSHLSSIVSVMDLQLCRLFHCFWPKTVRYSAAWVYVRRRHHGLPRSAIAYVCQGSDPMHLGPTGSPTSPLEWLSLTLAEFASSLFSKPGWWGSRQEIMNTVVPLAPICSSPVARPASGHHTCYCAGAIGRHSCRGNLTALCWTYGQCFDDNLWLRLCILVQIRRAESEQQMASQLWRMP